MLNKNYKNISENFEKTRSNEYICNLEGFKSTSFSGILKYLVCI